MNSEKQAIEKTPLILSLFTSIIVLILHFAYLLLPTYDFQVPYILKAFQIIINTGLFDAFYYPHVLALILGTLYAMGVKSLKSEHISLAQTIPFLFLGMILYAGSIFFFFHFKHPYIYILQVLIGYILTMIGIIRMKRIIDNSLLKDQFNKKNRLFKQEKRRIENEYSVNIKTKDGWLNIINPFRATMVLGTPGSGKSYTIVEEFIRQHIQKDFTMLIYDFKYPDLSKFAYNCFFQYCQKNNRLIGDSYIEKGRTKKIPKIYIVNLNDPANSHRVNPIAPYLLRSISDAISAAESLFLNINKEFIKKKDFFNNSAVNLFAAIIWFLRRYEDGKYCSIPHAVSLLMQRDEILFRVLESEKEVYPLLSPFLDAHKKGALEQLSGQTASARIPISRLATKQLYWILGKENFRLDINHPNYPAILFLANHPDSQKAYSPIYGLIASTLVKEVNKKDRLPLSLIIDELPTIYINGLDNLIATARSNKISTLLSFQDLAQLERDYGREVANTIFNTVGNKITGSVVAETAKKLSDMIGKAMQKRANINYSSKGTSTGTSTTLDYLIPPETISQLSQGEFCGVLADTYEQSLEQKIFQSQLLVDKKGIPQNSIPLFTNNNQSFEKLMNENYQKIISDIEALVIESDTSIQ